MAKKQQSHIWRAKIKVDEYTYINMYSTADITETSEVEGVTFTTNLK